MLQFIGCRILILSLNIIRFESLEKELLDITETEFFQQTKCYPPCSYYVYDLIGKKSTMDPSVYYFPEQTSFGIKVFFTFSAIFNFVEYYFVLPRNEITEENEELLFGLVSLVGELGGSLGLFLGFSFMTIWDIGVPIIGKIAKMIK